MNIVFINPSPTVEVIKTKNKIVKRQSTYPPLGLLYLGTILEREGHKVKIFDQDVTGFTAQQVLDWVKNQKPEIVGISPLSISFDIAMEIVKLIKKWNSNIKIIMGNILSTMCSDLILKEYKQVDFCVRGEAEETLPELVQCIEKNNYHNLETIKGITFVKDEKIVFTPDRPSIKDLDKVPIPNRKLIDFNYRSAGKKFTILATSRGCPFSCSFCAIHINSGLKGLIRTRSLPNVIQELKLLHDNGYKEFHFVDDCFIMNQKRVMKLCSLMRKEGLDFEWACEGRVDQTSLELLSHMRYAGCNSILFGIESVNQRMLDYYNKRITPEISKLAVKKAVKAKIENIIGLFILGGPGETIKEIIDTIKFSQGLDLTFIQYQFLHILMGSDLWFDLEKKGTVSRERDWKKYFRALDILPNIVDEKVLDRLMINAYAQFLSRPKFLIRQFYKTMTSNYRIQLINNNIKDLLVKKNIK